MRAGTSCMDRCVDALLLALCGAYHLLYIFYKGISSQPDAAERRDNKYCTQLVTQQLA